MNLYLKKLPAAVATGITVALLLTAGSCNPQPQPQQPAPCVEADGEPCDDDPYDLDDLFEKKKTKAPIVKTPVRPTAKKTSGTTGRYR